MQYSTKVLAEFLMTRYFNTQDRSFNLFMFAFDVK